jgi:hypothetical protein
MKELAKPFSLLIRQALRDGEILLLIDGLDEICNQAIGHLNIIHFLLKLFYQVGQDIFYFIYFFYLFVIYILYESLVKISIKIIFSYWWTLLSLCGSALDQSDIMLVSNHLIESKSEIMQMSEDILLERTPSDLDCNAVLLGFHRFRDLISKPDVKR